MTLWDVIQFMALTFLSVGICASASPHPDWKNSLKPNGNPDPELFLASEGKAHYTILLSTEPTTQERKAAADLAMWLKEMTGADFEIVSESEAYNPTGKEISVGRTNLLEKSNIPVANADLDKEGYAIAVKEKTLFLIGGKTRGIINAVYALLEEDLGCRWYDQTSSQIPKAPNLKFHPVPRQFQPILEIRDPYYWDAFDGDWSLRNRTNSPAAPVPIEWGGHVDYALFVHTYDTLVPADKYFDDHPEYFSELNGERNRIQLCLSHPDVLRIVIEEVKAILNEKPYSDIVSVSPNDTTGYCECAKCKAVDDAEGTKAGMLIKFVNQVADAIRDEHPNVKVSTLAYLGTFMPPKTIRPRDNVAIQLCTDSHAWPRPFLFITQTENFQTAMKAWADIGADIHIWDYTTNFSHYSLPMPNMPVVSENIRFFIEHNAKGVMLQGAFQSPGSDNAALRCWVWAKQLWDSSLDTRELMRDFIFGYYGTAAEPIWEYNDLLWQIWEEYHKKPGDTFEENPLLCAIRYRPDIPFLSNNFIAKSLELSDKAVELAEDPEIMRRVRLARVPIIYTALCQGLGFISDDGQLQPGKRQNGIDYESLFAEFEKTVKSENITYFKEIWSEVGDTEERLKFWRERLIQ